MKYRNTDQQNSEDEFEEHSTGKWKRGKSSMLLLSDLFSGKDNELFESEEKKSEIVKEKETDKKETEIETETETDSETETETETETDSETETETETDSETEIEISESSDDDIEVIEEKELSSMNETIDELLFLADCYDYLICESQLQQRNSTIIQVYLFYYPDL